MSKTFIGLDSSASFNSGETILWSGNTWISASPNTLLGSEYYTSAQTDALLGTYLPLTGGTMSGDINMQSNNIILGDNQIYDDGSLMIEGNDAGIVIIDNNGAEYEFSDSTATFSDSSSLSIDVSTSDATISFGNGYLSSMTLTANRTWKLPNASGTIALISDIPAEGLAPTLAQGNTTSGNDMYFTTTDKLWFGTDDAHILMDSGDDYFTFNEGTGAGIAFENFLGYKALISLGLLTTTRDFEFPDKSGTIALTSDIPSDIMVTTGTTQEISGLKTFTSQVNMVNGLYVSGTTTYINTTDMNISDNLITINSGETGSGVTLLYAGIEVDRGAYENYVFLFDESQDNFRIGQSGTPTGGTQAVATREDSPNDTAIAFWNDSQNRFDTSSNLTTDGSNLTASTYYGDGSNLTGIASSASPFSILISGETTTVWDLSTSTNAEVTLGGDITVFTINGASDGMYGTLKIIQGGVGGYSITLPANSKVANGGNGTVVLSSGVGDIDILSFVYDGTDFLWNAGYNFN